MSQQIAFTMWKPNLELHTTPAKRGSRSDRLAAGQRREWEKKSETDTPQSKAHQPYRSREKDSANAFTNSLKMGLWEESYEAAMLETDDKSRSGANKGSESGVWEITGHARAG
jgi:hypothetical protein